MIRPGHPSMDELADLHAGILADDDLAQVSAHVADCGICTAELAALDDVTTLLAAEGAATIPVSVAALIDEALHRAALERDAGVTSLAEHREKASTPVAPRRSRWTLIAGAAATVLIGFAGFSALHGPSQSGVDSSAAEAGGNAPQPQDDALSGGDQSSGPRVPPTKLSLQPVTKRTLSSYAHALASTPAPYPTSEDQACGALPAGPQDVAAAVSWRGSLAYVVVDPGTRKATVYECGRHIGVLYSTQY